jgi:hypothetical protein
MAQFAPPAKLAGQVFADKAKSPLARIGLIATEAEPMLLSMTLFPALVAPKGWLPNARLAADKLITDRIVKVCDFVLSTLPATSTLWNTTV